LGHHCTHQFWANPFGWRLVVLLAKHLPRNAKRPRTLCWQRNGKHQLRI